jgi:hypothetical protein
LFAACRREFIDVQQTNDLMAAFAGILQFICRKVDYFSIYEKSIAWQTLLVKSFASFSVVFCRILENKRVLSIP